MIRTLHRLARDRRGVTIIEFAIVLPVMLLMMMGLGDLLYQEYAQSILSGAVQKAARDSGIEGGSNNTTNIDNGVVTLMAPLIKNLSKNCTPTGAGATWCSVRKTYDRFSAVGTAEPFVDSNANGVLDIGECFSDENGNGDWDTNPQPLGQGGASAVALYTMTITYPRIFPVAGLFKWPATQTITATTLLKNQPYATQTMSATICRKS
ncbi:hypothetical protein AWL63_13965 [Sphingomonas panacis]|uniref:TadE-like domain-containing protein n=1 Tax=Sphingomonas panacis TaxID=1560345 RepID=A0A1B3ZBW2_9SPHN|nr:TadE/TadG family type IV pilus assembly protein [Sphingomonas panacis]AOH84900.1 hypothetical protein AWL63_13965 [Sphingomonas panacis]